MSLQTQKHDSWLIARIKRRPLVAFFILAFAISWTAWFSGLIINKDLVNSIAAFGPTLSAFIVLGVLHPEPSNSSYKKRVAVFGVGFLALTVYQLLSLKFVTSNFTLDNIILSFVPSALAAYVISSIYHPKKGVADLMQQLKHPQLRSVWVWVALLLPFVWQIVGSLIDYALGGAELFSLTAQSFVILATSYPFIFFFAGPLPEEAGWRGLATPLLQQKYTPLIAGLIIGVIWSAWHFPLHVVYLHGDILTGFLFRLVYNVPLGVLFGWLYNRSGGNLFACLLLHASVNSSSGLFGNLSGLFGIFAMIAFVVVAVFTDKMYRKKVEPQKTHAVMDVTV